MLVGELLIGENMDGILLQTKLSLPVLRARRVTRQKLLERLNADLWSRDGFTRKLTLVSAPAGFGKTTLIAEWVEHLEFSCAWLGLDEADNDPVRFMTYLVTALQTIEANIGQQTLAMLQAPQALPLETLLTPLINELTRVQHGVLLVLEDFHAIRNPVIQRQVSFLLEHQPAQMHLVLISRQDPVLPMARLRAQELVCEIRQDDLRFSEGETTQFLHQIMKINLSLQDMLALHRRTEGWAAGLQLVALSIKGQEKPPEFIQAFTGSNRFILDYLFEEVYAHQSPEIQDFLVNTSVLQRLHPDLCDALLERNNSQAILESLEHANLFLIPLDLTQPERGTGYWYRYHGLFQDLLYHQLQIQPGHNEVVLHRRAAGWYENHGHLADALRHALAAGDWADAAALIHRQASGMLKRGEVLTLIGWFRQLPVEFLNDQPGLLVAYSWVLTLTGEYEAAETCLERAEQNLPSGSSLAGEIYAVRAYLARGSGNVQETIKYSEKALAWLPAMNQELRVILLVNLGMAYWHSGQIDQTEVRLMEALIEAQASENDYAWLTAKIFLGRAKAVRGQLHEAADVFREALRSEKRAPILAVALLDLGALHYEWDEIETAKEYLDQAIDISNASGNIEFQAAGCLLQVRLYTAQKDREAADTWLAKSQELAQNKDAPAALRARVAASCAITSLERGELAKADDWAKKITIDLDPHPLYRYLGLTQEKLLIAQGHPLEAAERLAKKHRIAEENGWGYGAIAALVYQAMATPTRETAVELISQAVKRSQPGGFIRTYTEAGVILAPLLLEAARNGVFPEYIGRILHAIEQSEQKSVDKATGGETIPEPLSERELEVLRLLAAGLSNQEMAEQLTISLGTVKTHIHNIYGKLGVGSRTQAIASARDLNLI
jgi:LuxR family maltose regulon positive regulatory protein